MLTLVLLLATVLFGSGVLLDLGMLLFAPMMFDAPGAEDVIYPWLIVGSMMLYPLLALIGLGLAWHARAMGRSGRALGMLALPLLGAGLIAGAFALLQVMCAGEFTCGRSG